MTAAAAALGYTTGAVSQQMATLQRSLRVELFTQVGRSVQLTDAGQLLVDHAVALLALARQTEQALADLPGRPQGRVLIGVFGTAAAALLSRVLLRVREQCPGVHLRSVEVDAIGNSVTTGRPSGRQPSPGAGRALRGAAASGRGRRQSGPIGAGSSG